MLLVGLYEGDHKVGLSFPGEWRFTPPVNGDLVTSEIPDNAIWGFIDAIDRIAGQGQRWWVLEHFKTHFGNPHRSSSESWAESDLHSIMRQQAQNAPLFLEAFHNACASLREGDGNWYAPDEKFINKLLSQHGMGYQIINNELVALEYNGKSIDVEVVAPSIEQKTKEIINQSLSRSDELLAEGRSREAVQEVLWLLETVSTAFRGVEYGSGKVEGKYFNNIIRELRSHHKGSVLDRALDWATQMHGFLSSPKGGGVRHGSDLKAGVSLNQNEARLFCNLTRSYISFLLSEHKSL